MSKLVWDATGSKIYETGIDHVILFVQNSAATDTNGYNNGVAWNGVTNLTESPSGADSNDLYADNIKYLSLLSAEDFGATIEAYTYPDEWGVCDGSAEPATGVRIYQQNRKGFALFYRTIVGNDVEGNDFGYMYHFIYNCKASPSERGYQTVNDSPDAISFSWEITTTPVNIDATGYKPSAHITIDGSKFKSAEDKAKLDAFLAIVEGSENADSIIQLPDQIISYFSGSGPEPTPTTPSVTVTPETVTIDIAEEDKTAKLTAAVDPQGTAVEWSIVAEPEGCATVSDSGLVTGVAVGTATVTATITVDETDYTDTCAISIIDGQG